MAEHLERNYKWCGRWGTRTDHERALRVVDDWHLDRDAASAVVLWAACIGAGLWSDPGAVGCAGPCCVRRGTVTVVGVYE